jgi:ribosomal protein S9
MRWRRKVMPRKSIMEPARRLPVTGEFDVLVAGGGVAGVSAAIAAARNGAKTCLLEKEHVLGGLATLANVWVYLPLCDGYGHQVIGGLGEELFKASVKYGRGEVPSCWRRGGEKAQRLQHRYQTDFSPDSFAISLDEICLRAGVTLMFDTRVCSTIVRKGRIEALIVENKAGRSALTCGAVVDATGDADVCHLAGERTAWSDDNRKACWSYFAVDGRLVRAHPQDPPVGKIPRGARTYRGDIPEDVTEMNLETRRMALRMVKHLRHEHETDDVSAVSLPAFPSFRMTRRLVGVAELRGEHARQWASDAIGMTGVWYMKGPVYAIPWGCLVGRKTANLAAAGRCISAEGKAWDITRVIPPGVVTGQAAGTGAAIAAGNGKALADLDVPALQQQLKAQGVLLNRKLVEQSLEY